jgi:hypothetical protein
MLRHAFDALQEGVLGSGDLKVTPQGSGLHVNVAAGAGFVQGDTVTDQGLYRAYNDSSKGSDAFEAGDFAAANGSNPRIDQVCAKVFDQEVDAGGQYKWRLVVVPGTATSGATLDNRTGAAALPSSHLRLADVLVPTSFTGPFVQATHIRDRRPWARGAWFESLQATGADYSVSSTSYAVLDATNLQARLECSGVPMRITFRAGLGVASTSLLIVQPRMDAAVLPGHGTEGQTAFYPSGGAGPSPTQFDFTPAAGSHLFTIYTRVTSGTTTIDRGTDYSVQLTIEEILRPNIANTGA